MNKRDGDFSKKTSFGAENGIDMKHSSVMQNDENGADLRDRSILSDRAKLLAIEPEKAETGLDSIEITKFRLNAEIYGIESGYIRELFQLKAYTPLPGVPPFVLGITNVRGQIISIIDFKKYFNLPDNGLGQLNRLIILQDGNMEFGILADEILGTWQLLLGDIKVPEEEKTGIDENYVRGITPDFVIILDTKKLIHDPLIIIDQKNE